MFRLHTPLQSVIRCFKSGPDVLNDFGAWCSKDDALPSKKILKIRCNFNHWLAAELELFKRADDIPLLAILGMES